MLRVFRGDNLELLDSIKLELGPNRVAYEPHSKILYVGYGGKDAGKDYGMVGIIDAKTDKRLGDIKVDTHPAELLLDKSGKTLYVSFPRQVKFRSSISKSARWYPHGQRAASGTATGRSTKIPTGCSSAHARLRK